jgi:hypothetical protein
VQILKEIVDSGSLNPLMENEGLVARKAIPQHFAKLGEAFP